MWVHIVIFVIGLSVAAGWKTGWAPHNLSGNNKGKKLFLLIVFAGNLLGIFITVTKSGSEDCDKNYRMEKTAEGMYEEDFVVSVEGGKKTLYLYRCPGKNWRKKRSKIYRRNHRRGKKVRDRRF